MTLPTPASRVLFFGCGNMGRAMLDGWLAASVDPHAFVVVDPYAADLPNGVELYRNGAQLSQRFDTIILAIKPQMFTELAPSIERLSSPDALLISVLAGTRGETLSVAFQGRKIVRLMPNLAAALGLAPLGLWSQDQSKLESAINTLFAPLGCPVWIDAEEQMDAVTALAGSGPAFVYRFIDALVQGGVALGLSHDQATEMTVNMVRGAATLTAHSDATPAELAARVTSPGGTTAAGLAILDHDNALQALLSDTLRAARDRGIELSKPNA